MKQKIVLSLSGGMDSATLAALYSHEGFDVHPVFFDYGSKHGPYEKRAAIAFCQRYGLMDLKVVDLHFMNSLFKSNLLMSGEEIPEGYYTDANMSQTVVPSRNMIFASILAGYAESIDSTIVALGVHSGDHAIYPDCRPEFVRAMSAAICSATDGKVALYAPFLLMDKAQILRIGQGLHLDYSLTRTCYKNQELSCGKCGSCQERLEAFKAIGEIDPVRYE